MKFTEKYSNQSIMSVVESLLIGGNPKPCVVCKHETTFISIFSEQPVCSDECKQSHMDFIDMLIAESEEELL